MDKYNTIKNFILSFLYKPNTLLYDIRELNQNYKKVEHGMELNRYILSLNDNDINLLNEIISNLTLKQLIVLKEILLSQELDQGYIPPIFNNKNNIIKKILEFIDKIRSSGLALKNRNMVLYNKIIADYEINQVYTIVKSFIYSLIYKDYPNLYTLNELIYSQDKEPVIKKENRKFRKYIKTFNSNQLSTIKYVIANQLSSDELKILSYIIQAYNPYIYDYSDKNVLIESLNQLIDKLYLEDIPKITYTKTKSLSSSNQIQNQIIQTPYIPDDTYLPNLLDFLEFPYIPELSLLSDTQPSIEPETMVLEPTSYFISEEILSESDNDSDNI